jgi:AcrR family transcriptional regulator
MVDHMGVPTADRPLRADAARNRERLLRAAEELFAAHGLDVTLDDVARRAGLGVGTVYRRFPTKEHLIEALFEDKITALAERAEAAAREPDPWAALVRFLADVCTRQAADRGLREVALGTRHTPPPIAVARDRLVPALTELFTRAKRSGQLRDDVHPTDIPALLVMIGAVTDFAHGTRPALWQRYLNLLIDGLAARREVARPLPTESLNEEELHAAMSAFHLKRR